MSAPRRNLLEEASQIKSSFLLEWFQGLSEEERKQLRQELETFSKAMNEFIVALQDVMRQIQKAIVAAWESIPDEVKLQLRLQGGQDGETQEQEQ